MQAITRALLYVTRKKGKSVLLFLILLIMATFVLTGLSTRKASQAAQKNLREALGGEFQVVVNLSESNPYFRSADDGAGNVELYTERPITQEVIDSIMDMGGMKYYDASTQTLVSTNLSIFPGNVPLKGEMNNKIYARTVSGTESSSFFQSGTMELIEGDHITGNEKNAAIISKAMADQNSLKIGDTISLEADERAEARVIGIYEILKPDPAFASIVTYEKLENQIFIDMGTLQNLFGDVPVGFYDVTFTVEDPAGLDEILSKVNGLSSIDWRAFTVTTNNQTYLDAVAPLRKLQTLVSSVIFVIVWVSGVILSLILTMWGRGRIRETGVLLSLGIGKTQIIGQYLAEVLMIAVLAFGCSYFTSSAIADELANGLLGQNSPAAEEQAVGVVITQKDGFREEVAVSIKDDSALPDMLPGQDAASKAEASTDRAEAEQISVTVDFYNMLQLYLIGILIIILSVGISSLWVMRLKPREILSKMS